MYLSFRADVAKNPPSYAGFLSKESATSTKVLQWKIVEPKTFLLPPKTCFMCAPTWEVGSCPTDTAIFVGAAMTSRVDLEAALLEMGPHERLSIPPALRDLLQLSNLMLSTAAPDGHGYTPKLADSLSSRRNCYRANYGSTSRVLGAPEGVLANIVEVCCCATNAEEAMGVAVAAAPFLGCGLDLNIQCAQCRFEISVNAHAHPRSTSPKLISIVVQNAQDSLSKVRGGEDPLSTTFMLSHAK
jgi:hypothetical protein